MIRITDQYFWHVVFGVFYLVLLIMGTIIVSTETRMPFNDIGVFELALVGLASFRLTQLFVKDDATKWLREQFWDVKKVRGGVLLERPKAGPRRTVADLFSCESCLLLWVLPAMSYYFLMYESADFVVMFLAIAGTLSLLLRLTRSEEGIK